MGQDGYWEWLDETRGSARGGRVEGLHLEEETSESVSGDLLLICWGSRSLVCVEGDCSMNKFQTKEGTPTSALSIVQSECSSL